MKKNSIRLAKDKDIPEIMEIIKSAKSRLKAAGSPQWQGIYPDENSFKTDIDKNWSYLLIVDKEIAGVAALMQIPEKSYEKIENGSWLQENNLYYTTIHRIVIADQFAGRHLATIFFQLLIEESKKLGFNQVRFDTHRLNYYAMQHLGEKLSFQKRGIIYVNEYQDNARIAYQLIIDK